MKLRKIMSLTILLVFSFSFARSQRVFTYLADFKNVAYYGFADSAGNTKTAGNYNLIMRPAEGVCRVWAGQTSSSDYSNIVYGFCLLNGVELVMPQYQKAEDFSDGLAMVAKGNIYKGYRYGFVNKKGREQIPLLYTDAKPFTEGLAAVATADKKWQYIDSANTVKIAGPFLEAEKFSEGLAGVSVPYDLGSGVMSFRKGYIDRTGKMVIQPAYNYVRPFKNGYAVVSVSESGTGEYKNYEVLIDKKGNRITKQEFKSVSDWPSDGLRPVKISGSNGLNTETDEWGVVDSKGILQAARFQYQPVFSEGLAPFSKNGLYGYKDKTGKEIIPLKYKSALSFADGLAPVQFAGTMQWGYINKKGETVIKPEYVSAAGFKDGYAVVMRGKTAYDAENVSGVIDRTGKTILPFEKRTLSEYDKGRWVSEKQYISYYQYADGKTSLACDVSALVNSRYAYAALLKNDVRNSLSLLEKATGEHCAIHDYWLGYILLQVNGPLRDTVRGAKLIEDAANKNYPEAMYSLGYIYAFGPGVKKDEALAKQWLVKAFKAGVPAAYTVLGAVNDQDHPAEGAAYYEQAADLGDANAMYNLALLYRDGRGVKKNDLNFSDWLNRAAQRNYEPAKKLQQQKAKDK